MVGAPATPPSTIKMGEFGRSPVAGPGAPNWPRESAPAGSGSASGRGGKSAVSRAKTVGGGGTGGGLRSYATPMGEVEVPLSIKRARYRAGVEVQTESQELMQVGWIGGDENRRRRVEESTSSPLRPRKKYETHFRAQKKRHERRIKCILHHLFFTHCTTARGSLCRWVGGFRGGDQPPRVVRASSHARTHTHTNLTRRLPCSLHTPHTRQSLS